MAPPHMNSSTAFSRCAEVSPAETARKAPVPKSVEPSHTAVRVTCVSAGDAPLMSSISATPSNAAFSRKNLHTIQSQYSHLAQQHIHSANQQHVNNLRVRSRNAEAAASQLQFRQYLVQAQRAALAQQQYHALRQPVVSTPGDNHRGVGVRFSPAALAPVLIRISRHVEERLIDEHDPRKELQVPSIFDEPAQLSMAISPARWVDIVNWMARIIDPLKLTPEISVYALILLERYLMASNIPLRASNWRGIVLTAIVMAQKMQLDNSYHNFQVCFLCAPFNKYHLRAMELEFLSVISFDAYVSIETYNSWAECMLRPEVALPRPVRPKLLKAKRQRFAPEEMAGVDTSSSTAESEAGPCARARFTQKRKLSLHTRSRSNPQAMLLSMCSAPLTGVPPQQPGSIVPRHARSTSTLPYAHATDSDSLWESLPTQHVPSYEFRPVSAPKPVALARPVIAIDSASSSVCSSLMSSPQSISSIPFSPSNVSTSSNDGAHAPYVNTSQHLAPNNHVRRPASMYQVPGHHSKMKPVSPPCSSHEAAAHFNFQQHQHHAALLATAPGAAYAQYAATTAATTSGHVASSLCQHSHSSYSHGVPLTYSTTTSGTTSSSAAITAQYMRALAVQQMAQLSALPAY